MWKRVANLLLIVVLATSATAATTGDPLDTNDGPIRVQSMEVDCARAVAFPQCNWCMTQCIYAIMADLWTGGGGWDWNS